MLGKFPNIFKTARVTPVYKRGSQNQISNYRPVSLLCNLSKVFESVLYKRLESYFRLKGFLLDEQYGFRKNKNTELAIFSLINGVLPAFEESKFAICVFLDYSACFDTLCRDMLLRKLGRYGIRGPCYDLIKSYFTDRKQFVSYGNCDSATLAQKLGVIQGSKCGPLFYDIYTSDIRNICMTDELLMYADDTCLMYVGDDLTLLTEHVNHRLEVIADWCRFNKLSLNPDKCSYMLMTNKNILSDPVITLGGCLVSRVSECKYLGINMDDKLKYHSHIKFLSTKLARICGCTYRLRYYLNEHTAKNLYYSCLYSAVSYGISVWGGILQCTQRGSRLERLYDKAVLNIFSRFYPQTRNIHRDARILKLADIHRFSMAIYMFKSIRLNMYPSLESNLSLRYPDHAHNTRFRYEPVLPFPRVTTLRINYKYQGVKVWNSLPNQLRDMETLNLFKKKLKDYLLEQY